MKILPFKASSPVSIGVELELQIVDPITYNLASSAKDLIRNISEGTYQTRIKPEITQGMIEINSSVHTSPKELYKELLNIRAYLLAQGKDLGICFSGGGTHPFQKYATQKIFPSKRFKNKSREYRYLSKRSTVFGQHVHIGCENADDALYLTHALARYVPQLIAISASSPYYQEIDTGFFSARSNVFNAFPLSGVIPYITTWQEFSAYFYKMRHLGIIQTMKDFYWDIRPKPEFGTVEVRVCDTPLTLKKAVIIAAYLQTISHYLLQKRPFQPSHELYYLYNYNRFQASRYGFEGEIINPNTMQHSLIADDILATIKAIERSTRYLKNISIIAQLKADVVKHRNDVTIIREILKKVSSLPEMVHEQCIMWAKK